MMMKFLMNYLAAVPNSKTATDVHTPFNQELQTSLQQKQQFEVDEDIDEFEFAVKTENTVVVEENIHSPISAHDEVKQTQKSEFDDFDDLLIDEDEFKTPSTSTSYAQSSAFVKAPIEVEAPKETLSKEAFIEAWQETAGKAEPELEIDLDDDFDLDAPF